MRARAVLLLALAACAPRDQGPPVVSTHLPPPASDDEAAQVAELHRAEERALETLAASDPRFAKRMGGVGEDRRHAASVQALAAGDADAAIVEGALDSFSFTARGRAVDEAAKLASAAPALTSPKAALERELLVRLVDEERLRLEEERAMPRGASALIRGVVDTWVPAASAEGSKTKDAWLARRLEEVRTGIGGTRLSRTAILELDDALDPLERLVTPDLPASAKALAELRVALSKPFATEALDDARRARVLAGVRGHLGVSGDAKDLRGRLEAAEGATRALAKERGAHADERAVARRAEALTLVEGTCGGNGSESRVRALAPPPERAAICGSLHALLDATDDVGRAAAAVALHDQVVVALWAVAIQEEGRTPAQAAGSAHPYFGAEPSREARLMRFAEVRPVAAIGAGLAAEILVRTQGAERWLAFGDAPLDVVERELAVRRASPPSPASPRP